MTEHERRHIHGPLQPMDSEEEFYVGGFIAGFVVCALLSLACYLWEIAA